MMTYKYKKIYAGYVVNVYNLLNYDIDLPLDDYKNIIMNQYTYQCVHDDIHLGQMITSQSYRCRLNGLLIADKNNKKKKHSYTYEINKLINLVDGWVQCHVVGVDIFNRLLVDIIIPVSQINHKDYLNDINIKDYLLQDDSLFQPYIKKNKYIND